MKAVAQTEHKQKVAGGEAVVFVHEGENGHFLDEVCRQRNDGFGKAIHERNQQGFRGHHFILEKLVYLGRSRRVDEKPREKHIDGPLQVPGGFGVAVVHVRHDDVAEVVEVVEHHFAIEGLRVVHRVQVERHIDVRQQEENTQDFRLVVAIVVVIVVVMRNEPRDQEVPRPIGIVDRQCQVVGVGSTKRQDAVDGAQLEKRILVQRGQVVGLVVDGSKVTTDVPSDDFQHGERRMRRRRKPGEKSVAGHRQLGVPGIVIGKKQFEFLRN